MPVHGKIRTGVAQLLRFSPKFAGFAYAYLSVLGVAKAPIQMSTKIIRAHHYVEDLLVDIDVVGPGRTKEFFEKVQLSRYVEGLRCVIPKQESMTFLVDSTGTERNSHCLAVICRGKPGARSDDLVRAFSRYL